jgi:hypothetical protein
MNNDAQVDQNPYKTPVASAASKSSVGDSTERVGLDFIEIAKKWEWYRLVYNGVLVTLTLLFTVLLFGLAPPLDILVVSVLGALVCNFFFLLGPAIDGYAQWISGSRSKSWGIVVLVLGVLFSVLLVLAVLGSLGLKGLDIPNQQ